MTSTLSPPIYRYLRGYALDPGFSTRLDTAGINEVVYRIPFERLEPGPFGEYVDVIDFDPASGCWYEPVDLRHEWIATQNGLAPSESVPQFHQQFVYCVAMKTIRHFEEALGRKVVWYPLQKRDEHGAPVGRKVFVRRLRIHPHAIRDANAYYDPERRALMFGYFDAAPHASGSNHPGGLVFTCLSPDIVAHETTHAILDSIHHRYIEDTNPDVAAFHEGFADVVALLQRFTFGELVENQLFQSSGRIDRYTVFGELATQFGEALEGGRGALRSMIGTWSEDEKWVPRKSTPADYVNSTEAHERGAVLVATIFDAFQRIYRFRTSDLFRIASGGTGELPEGSISPDLVGRLAREASQIAVHMLHICIRALDYCPSVDISFGDYLRALITADLDVAPEDETGYRLALIEAFRARGIFPLRVNTLSVESLRWDRPDFTKDEFESLHFIAEKMKPLVSRIIETTDRKDVFERSQVAQAALHELLTDKAPRFGDAWEGFLNKLGLSSKPVGRLFEERPAGVRFLTNGASEDEFVPPIEVHTVRPTFRASREGRQIDQVVVTLTQTIRVDIGDDPEQPDVMPFRGGCSLIMRLDQFDTLADPDRSRHMNPAESVDYVIVKNVASHRRLRQQLDYVMGAGETQAHLDMYSDTRARRIDFALLHRR